MLALTAEGSDAESPDAVYEYSPYGEQTSETLEDTRAGELNPFGYTGAYQFQDGTVHLSHRFLDTFTLNFTQPDPSRQELNNPTHSRPRGQTFSPSEPWDYSLSESEGRTSGSFPSHGSGHSQDSVGLPSVSSP